MAKRLGIKNFLAGGRLGSPGPHPRKQPVSFASYRARIFCSDCNKHFKHLEDAAIPLLVPMAKGRVLSLDAANQALLALWANKTAIALIAADEIGLREIVPMDHRRAVREAGRPTDRTYVGYFPWRGSPVISVGSAVFTSNVDPTSQFDSYGAILTFAQLAFVVFGLAEPLPSSVVIDADSSAMRQFWPPRLPLLHWTPGTPATNSNLGDLLNFVPLRSR